MMSSDVLRFDDRTVFQAVRDIRARWSPRKRRLRAKEGQHRLQALLRMIVEPAAEQEIWAVGAPADTDLQRLVGQC